MIEVPTSATVDDLWTDVEPPAARRLLLAALSAFSEHGYFATTTRDISERARLSSAAVYVHFPSKAEMLAEICRRGHAEVLDELEVVLAAPGTPTERVQRFVRVFSSYHARRQTVGRVIQYELRGLPEEEFREIARTRERFEQLLHAELEAGVASREFALENIDATRVTILSLGIDVARWFGSLSDELTPVQVGVLPADLVLRMIAAAR
jgi:AcrR family transcriptional regulator